VNGSAGGKTAEKPGQEKSAPKPPNPFALFVKVSKWSFLFTNFFRNSSLQRKLQLSVE
jgi:hypothetical protein